MSSSAEKSRVDLLLRQLYLKKQWLDTVIAGLESATRSVDHQFLESVAKVLGDDRVGKPAADLEGRQRAKLARLAQQVGRKSARRIMPHGAMPGLH